MTEVPVLSKLRSIRANLGASLLALKQGVQHKLDTSTRLQVFHDVPNFTWAELVTYGQAFCQDDDYRGISLMRKNPLSRAAIRPYA